MAQDDYTILHGEKQGGIKLDNQNDFTISNSPAKAYTKAEKELRIRELEVIAMLEEVQDAIEKTQDAITKAIEKLVNNNKTDKENL